MPNTKPTETQAPQQLRYPLPNNRTKLLTIFPALPPRLQASVELDLGHLLERIAFEWSPESK